MVNMTGKELVEETFHKPGLSLESCIMNSILDEDEVEREELRESIEDPSCLPVIEPSKFKEL